MVKGLTVVPKQPNGGMEISSTSGAGTMEYSRNKELFLIFVFFCLSKWDLVSPDQDWKLHPLHREAQEKEPHSLPHAVCKPQLKCILVGSSTDAKHKTIKLLEESRIPGKTDGFCPKEKLDGMYFVNFRIFKRLHFREHRKRFKTGRRKHLQTRRRGWCPEYIKNF